MSANEPEPPGQPHDPPLPATVGRYEVVRLLGEGAMGRVLLAHDPVLDRDVAVKHLRGDLKIPGEVRKGLLARMEHEARAAARVAHPNLVVLHDMGEDPSVGLFLVFEYVEGPTLKQRIVDDGRLPPADAARLARELGAALTVAHEAGILHRDIKPENVMLSRTGGKIADFGIARIPDSTLTHQGGLMGTPAYSAPETFRAGKFSPASDQFSLAATVYEAVSGRRAFPGDDAMTVAARIASDTPDRFAADLGLPAAVDEVLARALARRPEDRYPTCDAFGAALSRSLSAPVEALQTPRLAVATPTPQGSGTIAAVATPAPATLDERASAPDPREPAPERRTGQVLLGALLVIATATLVVRTALRPSDPGADRTPAVTEPPVVSAPARAVRARAPLGPLVPHLPKPSPTAAAPAAGHEGPPVGVPPHLADAGSPAGVSSARPPLAAHVPSSDGGP